MDWKGVVGLIGPAFLTAAVAVFTTFRRPLTSREDAASKLTDIAVSIAETSDNKYREQATKLADTEARLDAIEDELSQERVGRDKCERRYDILVEYLREMGLDPPRTI